MTEKPSFDFRLKTRGIKNLSFESNELIFKKHKKTCSYLNYVELLLVLTYCQVTAFTSLAGGLAVYRH